MARGWESKSVEAQQEEAKDSKSSPARPRISPEEIAKMKQKEGLLLSRRYVLEQLRAAHNPRHQETLQAALLDLEKKIAALDE